MWARVIWVQIDAKKLIEEEEEEADENKEWEADYIVRLVHKGIQMRIPQLLATTRLNSTLQQLENKKKQLNLCQGGWAAAAASDDGNSCVSVKSAHEKPADLQR